jgi:hypothetical protein
MPKPVALIILDGWGIREMSEGNAVVQANTPHYDEWLRTRERAVLDASGEAVGLPAGQMGNSEVGHLNLGAGRVVYQDITRIDLSIRNRSFFQNEVLAQTAAQLHRTKGKLHLIGLLGDGGEGIGGIHGLQCELERIHGFMKGPVRGGYDAFFSAFQGAEEAAVGALVSVDDGGGVAGVNVVGDVTDFREWSGAGGGAEVFLFPCGSGHGGGERKRIDE